jgi:3-oxoacyl-[acyl-carrier protein] reductase
MKRVLVTGATGSIGQEVVKRYAKGGYYVCIHYRSNHDKANALLQAINGQGELLCFDMRDKEAIRHRLEDKAFDVVINSAGIIRDNLLFFMEDAQWEEVIDTNLNALFYLIKTVTNSMIKKRVGSIVNITSISGMVGNSGQANYAASKGGVIALTKSLALELGRYNIRVNALAPGVIESEMIEGIPHKKELLKMIPLGRFGRADEVAECAYFIGDKATYVSGEVLNISGAMVR